LYFTELLWYFIKMKKILIADDTLLVRKVLKDALSKSGYEVLEAENGRIAYDLAVEEKPDLVILDVMMPEFSGIETTKNIRSDQRINHIPIIISTGARNMLAEFNKSPDTAIQGFLEKPYKSEMILHKIRAVLGD